MLEAIPEREWQIPEPGCPDEIQNYLHGCGNADDPVGVMETIVVCPALVASLWSVRAVMRAQTEANHAAVISMWMIICKSHRLYRHNSPLLCGSIGFLQFTGHSLHTKNVLQPLANV